MLSGKYLIESGNSGRGRGPARARGSGRAPVGSSLPTSCPLRQARSCPRATRRSRPMPARFRGRARSSALRARISWDQAHGRLAALPGSRLLAVSNSGTIPDTGAYSIYLADNQTRIGEWTRSSSSRPGRRRFPLRQPGLAGQKHQDDRLIVSPAPGAVPRMPFWHGDYPWRPYELGRRIGEFSAMSPIACEDRRRGSRRPQAVAGLHAWLAGEYALDDNSIDNLLAYVKRQLDAAGVISSDRTVVAELFKMLSASPGWCCTRPFGGRVNGAWAIALRNALRDATGSEPEMIANDDGIIVRFPQLAGPPPLESSPT